MSRPFKFTRALAPAVIFGSGLCAAAMATTTIPGSPPRIAAPCSPDGACLPRYETWGWYETRWRPFPGDVITQAPTPAGGPGGTGIESLEGPQPPTANREGQVAPERRPAGGGAGAGTAPLPGLPPLPGEGTPGADGMLPPVEEAPAPGVVPPGAVPGVVPPAAAPGGDPGLIPNLTPEATPEATPDPLDPFGAAPPTPPAWMAENASYTPLTGAPAATPVNVTVPAATDGPNLHGDDAPPALPAGLQDLLGSLPMLRPAQAPSAGDAVSLLQPESVRRSTYATPGDQGVMQVSAETPLGIQLINPASAIATEQGEDGLQQAIYFEASDLPAAEVAK